MTKKIIEYGFMGDEQGVTYIINHKPHVINNKYKFYKIFEKVEPKKSSDERNISNVEPKKVENKFIKKPEVTSNKKDTSKSNTQNESKSNTQNESKLVKKNLQKIEPVENDNTQNNNLLYSIPVIVIILILIIYFVIPSSKPQFFGRSQI